MKKLFSDRIGVTEPSTTLQLSGMNESLRNRLWNALRDDPLARNERSDSLSAFGVIADSFLKQPLDNLPSSGYEQVDLLHHLFFTEWKWYDVYNFIEFLIENYSEVGYRTSDHILLFIDRINGILEDELSGFRIVGTSVAPLTNEIEVDSIETTLVAPYGEHFVGVQTHFQSALKLFAKRPEPDYRNSIKEAISAVESLVTTIAGERDFGRALHSLREKLNLHPAFVGSLEKLYGYTSDENGVRHGIFGDRDVGFDEAKFMLVTCSAIINFLISKNN